MTFARWLALAASPSFALMMVASVMEGDTMSNTLCSTNGVSALSGMAKMYALMSLFHTPPWLRLISAYRSTT